MEIDYMERSMEIKFYDLDKAGNCKFHFAVICASYEGKWVCVRHRDRDTWEIPGGHREENEHIDMTAKRELFEETGSIDYEIEPVCEYSVTIGEVTTFGRLFYAKVLKYVDLPDSEIGEVKLFEELPENLTYKEILPKLYNRVLKYLSEKK